MGLPHLQAGVDAAGRRRFPAHVELDDEIAILLFGPEVVALQRGVVFADQHAMLGAPEFLRILRLEVSEILAVEKRHELRFGGGTVDGGREIKAQREDRAEAVGCTRGVFHGGNHRS